jgi:hypothetical protein
MKRVALICLMRQSNNIFALNFFTDGLLPSSLLGTMRFSEFDEIFAIFDWFSAIIIAESRHFPYALRRRIIVYSRELQMYELCAETLGSCLILRVDTPRIVQYRGSLLPVLFIAGSHCWQGESFFYILMDSSMSLKGQWSKKINNACRALLKCQNYAFKVRFVNPRWQRGISFSLF